MDHQRAEVDTSRPFGSVKEAVAVFGERILSGELYSLKSNSQNSAMSKRPPPRPVSGPISPSLSSPSFGSLRRKDPIGEETTMNASIKRLEAELEETKRQVMLLKERELEMEVVIASLDAEIHKNMSKLAEVEAAKIESRAENNSMNYDKYLPTLAHVLSLGEIECEFEEDEKQERRRRKEEKKKMLKKKMLKKKKPIVPLVGDMVSSIRKRSVSSTDHHSVYSPPVSGVLC